MQGLSTWQHTATCAPYFAATAAFPRFDFARYRQRNQPVSVRCVVTPQSPADTAVSAEAMPSLPQPRADLLLEVGRRSVLVNGASKAPEHHTDQQLAPFACGMSGTPVEVPDARPCQLTGTLPTWLQGDLYRNGPGTFDIRTDSGRVFSVPHWCGRSCSLAVQLLLTNSARLSHRRIALA